jgi:hypothetical protein
MGRFTKVLLNEVGLDRREKGYYSTPRFISSFITDELLRINPSGKTVLDPAVGREELLEDFFLAGKKIDSFDIVEHDNYRFSDFNNQDFIEYYIEQRTNQFFEFSITTDHDYWIANPPYNCHEIDYIKNNKPRLKQVFGEVGVHNMYSIFLAAMIDLAKDGALIGVIISDSFLTATMHSGLRQKILDSCSVHQLILCPTDLFRDQKADVRTAILILQKGKKFQRKVQISNRPRNAQHLEEILKRRMFKSVELSSILLSEKKSSNQFIIDVDDQILELFEEPRIGELFDCVTGISTGNDGKYLSKEKRSGFTVPFYKNPGSRKFKSSPDAFLIDHFLEEDQIVKDFMVRNKRLLGKKGITCSSMGLPFSACYLPENSTYGVNPNIILPENDLFWMLAYLNSSLVTYLVRGVLIRSNMVTSGYISQLPVVSFSSAEKKNLEGISKAVIEDRLTVTEAVDRIDNIVFKAAKLDEQVALKAKDFAKNLSQQV